MVNYVELFFFTDTVVLGSLFKESFSAFFYHFSEQSLFMGAYTGMCPGRVYSFSSCGGVGALKPPGEEGLKSPQNQ